MSTPPSSNPSHPTGARRRVRAVAVGGIALVATAQAGVLAWAFSPVSAHPWLLAVQAAAPAQVVVAVLLAVGAGGLRARRLLLVGAFLTWGWVGYVTWAQGMAGARPAGTGTTGAGSAECGTGTVTVAGANMLRSTGLHPDVLAADVLVTAETPSRLRADLSGDTHWRHAGGGAGKRGTNVHLWAGPGLTVLETATIATGASTLPAARVRAGGGDLWVVGVHLVAPTDRTLAATWRQELQALADAAATLGPSVVLVGDFNASVYHREWRHLREGLTDAGRHQGRRWVRTWPTDRWHGPLFDLDHVLVGATVAVCAYGEAVLHDSDHAAVWATVAP